MSLWINQFIHSSIHSFHHLVYIYRASTVYQAWFWEHSCGYEHTYFVTSGAYSLVRKTYLKWQSHICVILLFSYYNPDIVWGDNMPN